MTQVQIDAVRKLKEVKLEDAKLGDMQRFLAKHVSDALAYFCEQDEDFAAAVMVDDKSFVGCLQALKLPGRGLGYLSDFDVYRMAARYFFPEADVEWSMKISMPEKNKKPAKILTLKWEDLLGKGGTSRAPSPTGGGGK